MTPEQQRIAIAKVCGYRDGELKPFWLAPPIGKPFKACGVNNLPDYLNDLNAMHEAEKVLTPGQTELYVCVLERTLHGGRSSDLREAFFTLHATAAQRAEAFLRTLNLWTS